MSPMGIKYFAAPLKKKFLNQKKKRNRSIRQKIYKLFKFKNLSFGARDPWPL